MIELIQFPWSPFCLVQRRILGFSGVRFKIHNLKQTHDRSLIWKLTKERYYGVPIIRDGHSVIFETDENSQVIGKYLDQKLGIGLFPADLEGEQAILWRYVENEIEGLTFKLNDAHFRENVTKADQLSYIRHKERKFGRGCLDQWLADNKKLQAQLAERLLPLPIARPHRVAGCGDRHRLGRGRDRPRDRVQYELVNARRVAEAHFDFRRMHVDIDPPRIDVEMQAVHRLA